MDYSDGTGGTALQIRSKDGPRWPGAPRPKLAERTAAVDGRIIMLAHTLSSLTGRAGRIDESRDVLIDLRIAAMQIAEEGGDFVRYDTAAARLREQLAADRSKVTGSASAAFLHHASVERQLADLRSALLAVSGKPI